MLTSGVSALWVLVCNKEKSKVDCNGARYEGDSFDLVEVRLVEGPLVIVECDCKHKEDDGREGLDEVAALEKEDLDEDERDLAVDDDWFPEICISLVAVVQETVLVLHDLEVQLLPFWEYHVQA